MSKLTKDQRVFIELNKHKMMPAELSAELSVAESSVVDYLEDKLRLQKSKELLEVDTDLTKSPFWKPLKEEFNAEELKQFRYHWNEIMAQFKNEAFHTEQIQIIDVIKLTIMMSRVLAKQKAQREEVDKTYKELAEQRGLDPVDRDMARVLELERTVQFKLAAEETLNKEFRELLIRKNMMWKELKATREQRVKTIEDSKRTFVGWLSNLLNNRELRMKLGRDMEKMRLAMYKERGRLSEYHTYADGTVDKPLFTPENSGE